VLFNPGVHFLRDPRSGVYNFPRRALENIPPVEEFELGKMPAYVTSSKDEVLGALAKREGKQFVGSTSSTVAMLCQVSSGELWRERRLEQGPKLKGWN
jgi:dihydropteroate synthase